MFLLSNIADFDYKKRYPEIKGAIFALSHDLAGVEKNKDWHNIAPGSVVCIVNSSRRISTFYRVTSIEKVAATNDQGAMDVLVGPVVGKLTPEEDMSRVLRNFGASHKYLSHYKFTPGFTVGDLGTAFDEMKVSTSKKREASVGALKAEPLAGA